MPKVTELPNWDSRSGNLAQELAALPTLNHLSDFKQSQQRQRNMEKLQVPRTLVDGNKEQAEPNPDALA